MFLSVTIMILGSSIFIRVKLAVVRRLLYIEIYVDVM